MPDVTQQEAARAIGKSTSWLRELTKRGIITRNPDKTYPDPRFREEYEAFKLASQKKRSDGYGDDSYEAARARKVAAQARLAELEVLVREGELISLGAHRAVFAKLIEMFRAALLSVPGSWDPRIVGIKSPAEGTETMRLCSEGLLRDLANSAGELEVQDTAT